MAKYTAKNIKGLSDKVKGMDNVVNQAASLAVNKATTFARGTSIDHMLREVTLQESYIKKHIRVASRASPNNLVAQIDATARGTLLDRFNNIDAGKKGVKVQVNKGSSFKLIRASFKVTNLRGSSSTGIAMRNTDALRYYEDVISQGGASSKLRAKVARIARKAGSKPRGIEVLHSRSINQMFLNIREDVKPLVDSFMNREFKKDIRRLR